MKLSRRHYLHLAAGAAALAAMPRLARTASYPTRPMTIVVPVPPGGALDILARLIGQWLSQHLGQPVVVENRPGSAGNIAADLVAKSPPDGYTLMVAPDSLITINPRISTARCRSIR